MNLLVMYVIEGGVLIVLTSYLLNMCYATMESSFTNADKMLNDIGNDDQESLKEDVKNSGMFMQNLGYSSTNFLDRIFSSVDTSKLNQKELNAIEKTKVILQKMKTELNGTNSPEIQQDLDEIFETLNSTDG